MFINLKFDSQDLPAPGEVRLEIEALNISAHRQVFTATLLRCNGDNVQSIVCRSGEMLTTDSTRVKQRELASLIGAAVITASQAGKQEAAE